MRTQSRIVSPGVTLGQTSWSRPGRVGFLDAAGRIAAVAMVGLSVATGSWHSTAGDDADAERDAAVRAEETAARASPPTKEWMVAFYGGAPYTYPSTVTLKDATGKNDFTVDKVEWRGEPFIDPIYYGVRIVRWFTGGRTGGMLDFTHSKTLAELDPPASVTGTVNGEPAPEGGKLGDIFRRLEFSHGHNMLTLNGLMRLVDLHPRLSLYGGLGGGINLPHTEVQLMQGGRRTYEYQMTGPVAQAVIGIEFRVPRMSYFFEYKFTFASYDVPLSELDGTKIGLFADLYRQAALYFSGEPPPGGWLATRLVSHELIGGLGIRFGAEPSVAAP